MAIIHAAWTAGACVNIRCSAAGSLVARNRAAGRLRFTTDVAEGVAHGLVQFIAVGTPSRRGDGHADLSYVYAAAREIGAALKGFTVVVTKSTVPVGTGDEVERIGSRFENEGLPRFVRGEEMLADQQSTGLGFSGRLEGLHLIAKSQEAKITAIADGGETHRGRQLQQ